VLSVVRGSRHARGMGSPAGSRSFVTTTLALALAGCAPATAREPAPPGSDAEVPRASRRAPVDDPLGLVAGATWTYRGTWTRWDDDAGRELTTPVTWTTTILGEEARGGAVVWRIRGWPGDAPRRPGREVALAIEDGTVRVGGAAWLSLPVRDGDQTCDREVGYCWSVEAAGTGHDVILRTRPDVTLYHLEPGLGVTRFEYHHNGTTDDLVLDRVP
jgi:hypothetical protein